MRLVHRVWMSLEMEGFRMSPSPSPQNSASTTPPSFVSKRWHSSDLRVSRSRRSLQQEHRSWMPQVLSRWRTASVMDLPCQPLRPRSHDTTQRRRQSVNGVGHSSTLVERRNTLSLGASLRTRVSVHCQSLSAAHSHWQSV